jgi:HlyD family secretion protein
LELLSKPPLPSANGTTTKIQSFELPRKPKSRRLVAIAAAVLVIALVVGAVVIVRARSAAAVSYITAPVVKQTLVQSVTATGTVNPQNTIAVGTQESGTVSEIDVDYNSHVKKGQVLAKLDPTTFQAALEQAQAQLAQAQAQAQAAAATASGAQSGIGGADASEQSAAATALAAEATAQSNAAGVETAQSNVTKSQSALTLAQQTVARDASLLSQGYIAQSQTDADRSAEVAAQAALDSAKAAVSQAQLTAQASASQAVASRAQNSAQGFAAQQAQATAQTQSSDADAMAAAVSSSEAQVRAAELNLQKTVITSPVDGTVIARSVSVGTTVAASLQTPTLFTIAQNLDKMEVDLAVGEPDIGNVRSGDGVDFTVLAYPATTFHGVVSQVRIDPTTTNNVVTYDTVVLVNNQAGQLLPGMTANATIDIAKANDALVVPLSALSYQPALAGAHHRRTATSASSTSGAKASAGSNGATGSSPWGATIGTATSAAKPGAQSRIFVERNGALVRVPVTISLVSGTQAAVKATSGTLVAGDAVVTADSSTAHASAGTQSASRQSGGNPLTGGFGGGSARGIH